MKILSTLFCFLIAIIAMPVLLDGSADASLDGLSPASLHSPEGSTERVALSSTAAGAQGTRSARSRRPARIDLTMPYYRFGRAPTRIKD